MDKINMLTDRVKNLTKENELLASEIGELRKSTEDMPNIKTASAKQETPKSNTTKDPQEIENGEKLDE